MNTGFSSNLSNIRSHITTAEAVLCELLQTSDSAEQPAFKPCSALLKARNDGLDAAAQGELLAAT